MTGIDTGNSSRGKEDVVSILSKFCVLFFPVAIFIIPDDPSSYPFGVLAQIIWLDMIGFLMVGYYAWRLRK